jgi:hypothetical protein
MRKIMTALLPAFVLAMTVAASADVTTGGLTGRVYGDRLDGSNESPISFAVVTVSNGAQVEVTRTDSRGFYCFVSLLPGSYNLTIDADGYQKDWRRVHVAAGISRASSYYPCPQTRICDYFGYRDHIRVLDPDQSADVYIFDESGERELQDVP